MESLQLFPSPESLDGRTRHGGRLLEEPDETVFHETELFLADHLEREGDVAVAQVALRICGAMGSRDGALLEAVDVDPGQFPRTCSAVARAQELLRRPVAERPEGFWPRFLIELLDEATTY